MKCAGLKERCKWPEVGGPGLEADKAKGKAKEVAMSPRGGEKRKKKKMVVKVVDDDDIVEVPGPSGQRSGFDPGPFLERLDRLTGAVEEMTGQMRQVVDATCSVARGNERLMAGLETFLEECRFFTAPWDKDEESEDSGVECHIHANSDTSPTCSDISPTNSNVSPICSNASPTNSDVSPINSDVSPINSDVSPPNSYSVPPVRPARFCHTFRYIPCFLPVTYLSPCCYLLLPCVYPFHVFPPLMCFSYSAFHMSCVYHKDPVLSVSI